MPVIWGGRPVEVSTNINSQDPTRGISPDGIFDFIIIGSGFGGSICPLRLAEMGYQTLIMERGKRFDDGDFPESNWNIRNYLFRLDHRYSVYSVAF